MLDIVPSTENRSRSMMSLDLSPYLLSASPPNTDFSLHSLSQTPSYSPYSFFSSSASQPPTDCEKVCGTSCAHNTPLKSIMALSPGDRFDSDESLGTSSDSSSSPKAGKRVSFADESGMPLAEVRMVLDNPTAPPVLSIRGLTSSDSEGQATVDTNPLLAPDQQPLQRASFEADLRQNSVAVENIIVQGYELTCTVFVKNDPGTKRVFGRFTTDSWDNFVDMYASFSQKLKPGYDTYLLKFQVPKTANREKSIQFAVCFEVDGVQHWDNNAGQNYSVHWNQEVVREAVPTYTEDPDSDPLDFSGLVWCSHEDLDKAYY